MKTSAISYLLACPACGSALNPRPKVVSTTGEFVEGQLDCPVCDRGVARVSRSQIDFHGEAFETMPHAEPITRDTIHERSVAFDDPSLHFEPSQWRVHENRYLLADPARGQSLTYSGRFTGLAVDLIRHAWSGMLDIYVDDILLTTLDLYSESGSVERFFIVDDLPLSVHSVRLCASGRQNPLSNGSQIFFRELTMYAPMGEPGFSARKKNEQDANAYSERVESLINDVPDHEWVMDCGGGDRFFGLENVVNFEYVRNKRADVFGDIHKAPFSPGTFSLIISQAVFEHLANPFVAAAKIIDLLRPGGLVYVEVAFMQPLHAVPYHFFNMTDWGLKELFKTCEILDSGWFGPLSGTIDWLFRSVKIDSKLGDAKYAVLLDQIKELDVLVSHDELRAVASGMFILVRKPT